VGNRRITRIRVVLSLLTVTLGLTACGTAKASSGGSGRSTAHLTSRAVCARIDGMFYFPTVPSSGYTVSRATAVGITDLLAQAQSGALRAEAAPLQRALTANDMAAEIHVILRVQNSTCAPSGMPPAT